MGTDGPNPEPYAPILELDTPDAEKALAATRDYAEWLFHGATRRQLRPADREALVADFLGRLKTSPAAGQLLTFRFLGATWPPQAVAYVLLGLVWARAQQLRTETAARPPRRPWGASAAELRQAARIGRRVRLPRGAQTQLVTAAVVGWTLEAEHQRPGGRPPTPEEGGRATRLRPWTPLRYLAESLEGLRGASRPAKAALGVRLARQALEIEATEAQLVDLMKRAGRRRRRLTP